MSQRTGFDTLITSEIDFNFESRMFILKCRVPYVVWFKGQSIKIRSHLYTTLPRKSGLYSVYITEQGELVNMFGSKGRNVNGVLTAHLYWNELQQKCIMCSDERHQEWLNFNHHVYLHNTFGARLLNGFELLGFTLNGDGSANAHCTFTLTGGSYVDEDLTFTVKDKILDKGSRDFFYQVLNARKKVSNSLYYSYCLIPVYYRKGKESLWFCESEIDAPLLCLGKKPLINFWHCDDGWTLQYVPEDCYFPMYIVAVANQFNPVIAVVGDVWYVTKNLAMNQNEFTKFATNGPWVDREVVLLYRLLYQSKPGKGNDFGASLIHISDLRVM